MLEQKPKNEKQQEPIKNQLHINICNQLNQILGTKVNIKDSKNKGKIEIEYYSEDELDRLVCLLKNI